MGKKVIKSALLFMLVAAISAGCVFGEGSPSGQSAETSILSQDELLYFNGDEFFNGEYLNIRNQFLSSLYDAPEHIDLFQLFYCGSGANELATAAEQEAVIAHNNWEMAPDCACDKISRSDMDDVLLQHTGLTVSETDGAGLGQFTYLEQYDSYYHYHGDTNYRGQVVFSAGEQQGDTIRLFYHDDFMDDGDKVLTLRLQDGQYLFVSNQKIKAAN